jgi:hypothetical protein
MLWFDAGEVEKLRAFKSRPTIGATRRPPGGSVAPGALEAFLLLLEFVAEIVVDAVDL